MAVLVVVSDVFRRCVLRVGVNHGFSGCVQTAAGTLKVSGNMATEDKTVGRSHTSSSTSLEAGAFVDTTVVDAGVAVDTSVGQAAVVIETTVVKAGVAAVAAAVEAVAAAGAMAGEAGVTAGATAEKASVNARTTVGEACVLAGTTSVNAGGKMGDTTSNVGTSAGTASRTVGGSDGASADKTGATASSSAPRPHTGSTPQAALPASGLTEDEDCAACFRLPGLLHVTEMVYEEGEAEMVYIERPANDPDGRLYAERVERAVQVLVAMDWPVGEEPVFARVNVGGRDKWPDKHPRG